MADQARKQTDKILSDMEKEVNRIYSRASKEISEKWDKYMESHKGKVTSAYNDLQSALASGDAQAIREAKSVYERTVKNVTLNNDRYKAMVKETTAKLSHTNEVALDYVNGNMAKIYTLNYNEFANQEISGYTFTLVNEQAVKNLAKEDKSLLPKKKVDIPKDRAWNTKSINAEVLQGILQGENIPKIAKRLTHVTDMNKNSSIRNARTMVTGAENKGRQDSFKKAQSDGVIMVRRWVATNDDRTREAHAELDGQEVGIDEPWENEYGEIMYPGDPAADPANVYNCRCSIRSIVQGFKWDEEEEEVSEEASEEVINNLERIGQKDSVFYIDEQEGLDAKLKDIEDYSGLQGEEAIDVANALFGYQSDPDYCYFYKADSDIRSRANEEASEMADKIQHYIDLSPKYEGTIYRGMSVDNNTLRELKVGTTFDESQYAISSWSSNENIGKKFANNSVEESGGNRVIFEYENPKHGTPVSHLSAFPFEKEVLVNNKDVKYEVVSRKVYYEGKKKDIKYIKIKLKEV